MSRPPRLPTAISDLPDELLLHIGAQLTDLNRNTYLASLALVSKRWRPIAQEWLLKEPRFNLTHIHTYMWELVHHPLLVPQVRTLEIWSTSEGRVQRDERGLSVKRHIPIRNPVLLCQREEFLQVCRDIVAHFGAETRHVLDWVRALWDDIVPALFGVLLCALPNLKQLKLGDGWLMDFPIFSRILSLDVQTSFYSPSNWKHKYLQGALNAVMGRLEVLEVPTDMTAIYMASRAATVFDYRRFEKLKELGVTMKSLKGYSRSPLALADPVDIFPTSLEVLRISEATYTTANFLNVLCLAKNSGQFPALRRVEIYHISHLIDTADAADIFQCISPVHDVQRMFANAGMALYLYFPAWHLATWETGSTPWRLRKEAGAIDVAEERAYLKIMGPFGVPQDPFEPFEAEWDADGDAVMIQHLSSGSTYVPWWDMDSEV